MMRFGTFFTLFLCLACSVFQAAEPPYPYLETQQELVEDLFFGVPGDADMILKRTGFSLGYSGKYRQALWVSYILYAENLNAKKVRRSNKFMADPKILIGAVQPSDYVRTGYDRGHLAPAADMTYSVDAMKHSFFMTNISPQIPGCNRGIWKRLEKLVRQWARREEQLCIVTGPLFDFDQEKVMGTSGVPVPCGFYKVILDLTPPMKMIGFIIPNQTSKKRLSRFAVPVDTVERLTGCDFFSALPDDIEDRLEAQSDFSAWSEPD